MANFVQIGKRVINLELVYGAERRDRGSVVVYLTGGGEPWEFAGEEATTIWLKLAGNRHDLTDLAGGPYSITDNESTASEQPRT